MAKAQTDARPSAQAGGAIGSKQSAQLRRFLRWSAPSSSSRRGGVSSGGEPEGSSSATSPAAKKRLGGWGKSSWMGLRGIRKGKRSNLKNGGGNGDESPMWELRSLMEKGDWDTVREFLCQEAHPAGDEAGGEGARASAKGDEKQDQQKGNVKRTIESIVDFTGQNSLHYMCRFNPPVDVVKTVLGICPDLSLGVDCLDRTPLHTAAGWGASSDVVIELLDSARWQLAILEHHNGSPASSPPEIPEQTLRACLKRSSGGPDAHGKTPLHFAAERLAMEASRSLTQTDQTPPGKDALIVLKALADACPVAAEREDAGGLTPSDYVLRGERIRGHMKSRGRFNLRSKRKGDTAEEEDLRRRAVRYLVKARGQQARLRQKTEISGGVDSSNHSSESSITNLFKVRNPKLEGSISSEQERAERREDAIATARVLELMGFPAEEYKEEDERDEASLERIRKMLADKRKGHITCTKARENRNVSRRRRGPGRVMLPLNTIQVPRLEEGEGDDISDLTPPSDLSGDKMERKSDVQTKCHVKKEDALPTESAGESEGRAPGPKLNAKAED